MHKNVKDTKPFSYYSQKPYRVPSHLNATLKAMQTNNKITQAEALAGNRTALIITYLEDDSLRSA